MGDYYALLGVDTDASTAEIRAAFRRSANEAHPDHHHRQSPGDVDDPARRMSELNEAWWTLRDVNRRAAYDNARTPPTRTSPTAATDADVAPSPAEYRGFRRTLIIAAALLVVVILGLFLIAMAQSGSSSGH